MRTPDCRTCPLYEDHKARSVTVVHVYGLSLDPRTGIVTYLGREVVLTEHETLLFLRLLRDPGDVVPRDLLYIALYGDHESGGPFTTVLETYIARIRRKLASIAAPVEIANIRGRGVRVRAGYQS